MVEQKKLLVRCADNSVVVMAFVLDDGYTVKRTGTKQEIDAEIARMATALPPERLPILGWEEIADADILIDRTFRNAWITKGKKIEHDMVKARDIHRDHLRNARGSLLADLDVEYMRADEAGNVQKKTEIAARKQALRDITQHPDIEKAQTPDELKRVWF